MQRRRDDMQRRIEQIKEENRRITQDKDLVTRKFHETKHQLEQDIDKEIEELKVESRARVDVWGREGGRCYPTELARIVCVSFVVVVFLLWL